MLKKAIAILVLTISTSFAQTVISKYAGEFMSIGVGGRALGMGGAYTATANDVTAGYYNPAALSRLNYPQIALMHDERYNNLVNYNYGAVAIPYGSDMTFALSVMRLGIDGIPDTRNALYDAADADKKVIYDIYNPNARIDPSRVTEFSNQDWAFYLSFAKKYDSTFSYGANIKVIRRSIAEYSATGIGFDIGAIYSPIPNLILGANIQDVTTTLVAWSTGRNELVTPTAKIGAAYSFDFLWGKVTPGLDFDVRFENRKFASMFHVGPVSFDVHSGFEYCFKNIVSVRAGYNDVKQFTLGAGIKLPKLNIDYTYAKFSQSEFESLAATHRISLMVTLEEPRFLRKD